ncbi:uncharacterized protein YecE (DUF72 family) [Duganella sp. SG902]|uniref:DUF72 domain-containing protein n=1 Tax=Duganella sp. SG902 TaxID=2587016 RepID=UPI00159DDE14|nr:DUF72 domain-containing protein [Duganella sp. SG902]NVM75463.1 uncharacterized protein YecE (DUF72 family) [Duganella sp. SG902]
MAQIRAGIGGWDFAPWRDTFYPKDVPIKKQLEYASAQVTSIEINGTFYRSAKPEHFASWAAKTPDDFVFSVKATRYATNRKVLAEAGESIERFMDSGLTELGDKLGPILWQLAATKKFDADDVEAFFKLLPAKLGKRKLQHVLDARHDSFLCEDYPKLARKHKVATVITDSPKFPNFTELTGEFVYARLMDAQSEIETGYSKPALKKWARQAQEWQQQAKSGQVYVYFINGAKERAPAAAQHFISLL